MEVYIDGVKLDLKLKKNSLLSVLKKIEKFILEKNRVIVELKIDGNQILNGELQSDREVTLVEVSTRTYVEMIIESLYFYKKNVKLFFNNLENVGSSHEIEENVSLIKALISSNQLHFKKMLEEEDKEGVSHYIWMFPFLKI